MAVLSFIVPGLKPSLKPRRAQEDNKLGGYMSKDYSATQGQVCRPDLKLITCQTLGRHEGLSFF